MPIIRPTLLNPGPSSTASVTLNSNNSGDEGAAYRILVPTSRGSGELGLVRLTLQCSTAGTFICDHISVGRWSGTNADCTDIPVELTVKGALGCNLAASTTAQVTDWVNVPRFITGDKLVVCFDLTAGGSGGNGIRNTSAPVAWEFWFFPSPGASYNVAATPGGMTLLSASDAEVINLVEVC